MPVKSWTAVLTVSLELGDVALEVETEDDEGLMGTIDSMSIGKRGLGATTTEEDVIGVGINVSRGR